MVVFGSGYNSPMDREFVHHDTAHNSGFPAEGGKETGDLGVTIGEIGMTVGLGPVPNINQLSAKLRPGTKKLEFVFMGAGKGSGQSHTPGMYGEKQRQALAEMGRSNKINFTTHSTVQISGLSGSGREGHFSKAQQDSALQEVKRAIDFAADVAQGGAIVVHTGEFQRSTDAPWNKDKKFQFYEGEQEEATFAVVDTRSGQVLDRARKNRNVMKPVYKRAGRTYQGYDDNGNSVTINPNDYIDGESRKVTNIINRVPEWDEKEDKFKVQPMTWGLIKDEAKEMTEQAKEEWKKWREGKLTVKQIDESIWKRFFNEEIKENEVVVEPEEAYVMQAFLTNAANTRGWAQEYSNRYEDALQKLNKIKNEPDSDEKKMAMEQLRKQIKQNQEFSSAQWAQADEAMEMVKNVESADKYAKKQSFSAYADAGLAAMKQSQRLQEEGKLKKPLMVALENIYPESYGSHPDELIELVQRSQEAMAQKLMKNKEFKNNHAEALKVAKTHIKATFDTGHLNMWRKYWVDDDKKSMKQNDEAFKKWTLENVEKMAKSGIIGHIHLVDNYGYQDEHVAPGEGNVPMREIIKILKKNNFDGDLIVEPGADYSMDQSGFSTMTKTWRHFGIGTYSSSSGLASQGRTWENVGYGWVGQNQPPYFTVGGYVPTEDWSLWSGVQLE